MGHTKAQNKIDLVIWAILHQLGYRKGKVQAEYCFVSPKLEMKPTSNQLSGYVPSITDFVTNTLSENRFITNR